MRYESTFLNTELKAFLTEHQADIRGFLGDKEMQRAYTQRVFEKMLNYLRGDDTCGVFLILGNDGELTAAQEYVGFFLRDSDPVTKTNTNSDLLFERGDQSLAREAGIALDSSWFPYFSFLGSGVREADDFFYTP